MLWLACGSPCDDLDCGPNGTCDEDSDECMCDPFYEGVFCELETRANYLGRWTGTGDCHSSINLFDLVVEISQGVEIDELKIQSTDLLQSFSITGFIQEGKDVIIPDFMPNVGSNKYSGKIIDPAGPAIKLTLNADVAGQVSSCEYILTQ